MTTVKSAISETIKLIGVLPANFVTIVDNEIEEGLVVVSGDYDQEEDSIQIYFVVNGDQEVEFGGSFFDLVHEIDKTYLHENVHREQWYDGLDTARPVGETRQEYMMSRVEMEARARVDIPMDTEYYGKSEDFLEYMRYFNTGVQGSYDAIMYIESAQFDYEMEKMRE
jgi:hypothetical protein